MPIVNVPCERCGAIVVLLWVYYFSLVFLFGPEITYIPGRRHY